MTSLNPNLNSSDPLKREPSRELSGIIGRYAGIRIAQTSDNEKILEFLKGIPMNTPTMVLRYERGPDFFHFLRQQGDSHLVLLCENSDQSITGLGVFSFRKNFVHGRLARCAYLSDLRISPKMERIQRRSWRNFYAEILKHAHTLPELNASEYFYSAILDENIAAVRALTRNRGEILYQPLSQYVSVSLIAKKPRLPTLKSPTVRVRMAELHDLAKIRVFLNEENKNRLFGENISARADSQDELQRRLTQWNDFSIHSLLIAENKSGEIVGCASPWSSNVRKLLIEKMPRHLKWFAKILSLLGKAHPTEGEPLKILFMTHFLIHSHLAEETQHEIFSLLLDQGYDLMNEKGYHALTFIDFEETCFLEIARKQFYLQTTPATLYQVLHKDRAAQGGSLLPKDPQDRETPPAFEVGTA